MIASFINLGFNTDTSSIIVGSLLQILVIALHIYQIIIVISNRFNLFSQENQLKTIRIICLIILIFYLGPIIALSTTAHDDKDT